MRHRAGGGFNVWMLIQWLLVLLLLLILLLSFMPSSQPIYALSRSYPYDYRLTTQDEKTTGGIRSYPYDYRHTAQSEKLTKFNQVYPPRSAERMSLKGKDERDYFTVLAQKCRLEMQRRHWGFFLETPHCDMLQWFELVAA